MHVLSFLSALLPATAIAVGLAWDPVQDERVAWYELGYGATSGQYAESVEVAAPATSLEVDAPFGTYFGVRAISSDRTITSLWSNEVLYAEAIEPTHPLEQLGVWAEQALEVGDMALVGQWTFASDNGDDDIGTFDFTETGSPVYADPPSHIIGRMAGLNGSSTIYFRKTDANFLYDLGATSAFTVTGWFYPNDSTKAELFTVNRTYNVSDTILVIELQTDRDIKFRVRATTTTDTYVTTSAAEWVLSQWNFFAITYDDDDGDAVKLYIDKTTDQSSLGLRVNTTHSTGGTIPQQIAADAVDSFIGARVGSTYPNVDSSSVFNGDLADFRVYDTALGQTALEAIRDEGAAAGATSFLVNPPTTKFSHLLGR